MTLKKTESSPDVELLAPLTQIQHDSDDNSSDTDDLEAVNQLIG
jgi:hypothetical protein